MSSTCIFTHVNHSLMGIYRGYIIEYVYTSHTSIYINKYESKIRTIGATMRKIDDMYNANRDIKNNSLL